MARHIRPNKRYRTVEQREKYYYGISTVDDRQRPDSMCKIIIISFAVMHFDWMVPFESGGSSSELGTYMTAPPPHPHNANNDRLCEPDDRNGNDNNLESLHFNYFWRSSVDIPSCVECREKTLQTISLLLMKSLIFIDIQTHIWIQPQLRNQSNQMCAHHDHEPFIHCSPAPTNWLKWKHFFFFVCFIKYCTVHTLARTHKLMLIV